MALSPEGYVFVITYGRSGSTLIQTLLQSINGYFMRGENANALWPLFQSIKRIEQAKIDHGYREIEAKGPWFGINAVDPDRYAQRLVNIFVEEIIQPPEDARVIGFKEIRFHEAEGEFDEYLEFIANHFSPARFVFNLRNWQDVAKSGWWKNCDPDMVKALVEKSDAQFLSFAEKHPDSCFVAQYEEYVGEPNYWRKLFDFLGETFDPARVKELSARKLKH